MKKIGIVYTTVGSEEDAAKLAESVVELGLAACVNYSLIRSVYRWRGKLEKEEEISMSFKTDVSKLDELVAWIKDRHPYTLPALWWKKMEASSEYMTYIQEQIWDSTST